MKGKTSCPDRRQFLKAAGVGLLLSTGGITAGAARAGTDGTAAGTVATRPFGKSGRQVSMLSLGGMFDIPSNQLLLKQALRWGVTYWDTADCYGGGRSEKGIGKFFRRYPQKRSRVFLVTKSDKRDPKGMTRLLERSLQRLETDYIDDPKRPGAVLSLKTVPKRTHAFMQNGLMSEEDVWKIHKENPEKVYDIEIEV